MKLTTPDHAAPQDADTRKAIKPVVCYPPETLPATDLDRYAGWRAQAKRVDEITIQPRDAGCIEVPAGAFFRILPVEGAQVGDLNVWSAHDLTERFYSGKTRALHGTHLYSNDRLWSSFPTMRPMATITADTLDWYGFDAFVGSVHDVIGTRCYTYTGRLLSGGDYHYCCHSNLTRALADHSGLPLHEAEVHVNDVLNVFMCTGFLRETE